MGFAEDFRKLEQENDKLVAALRDEKERCEHLRQLINPTWVASHVHRCECAVVGAVILDLNVLSGEQMSRVQPRLFHNQLFGSVMRAARLGVRNSRQLLAATKTLAGSSWEAGLLAVAVENSFYWHSEYYARRVRQAWAIDRNRSRLIRNLRRMILSEGKYEWT